MSLMLQSYFSHSGKFTICVQSYSVTSIDYYQNKLLFWDIILVNKKHSIDHCRLILETNDSHELVLLSKS